MAASSQSAFAFDTETTLISDAQPWLTPAYVLGAAFDGQHGFFVQRQHLVAFLQSPQGRHGDHAPRPVRSGRDRLVVSKHLDIYDWVDRNRVYDTQILHRLYALGAVGHTASFKGQSTLEHCVQEYLGIELPKDVKDSTRQGGPAVLWPVAQSTAGEDRADLPGIPGQGCHRHVLALRPVAVLA